MARRTPLVLYAAIGLGALVFVGFVVLFTATGAGVEASTSFVSNFMWAYSAERHALQGSGCMSASLVPRLHRESLRKSGMTEAQLDRACTDDGRCGTEVVQCVALEKAPVPCSALASIHLRYGKPKRPYTVKTITMPALKIHCDELYGEDGKLVLDRTPEHAPR